MSEVLSPGKEEIRKQLAAAKNELYSLRKQIAVMQGIYSNLAVPESDFHANVVKAILTCSDDNPWKGDTRRSFDKNLSFIQSSFFSIEKNKILPIRKVINDDIRELSGKISKLEKKVNNLTVSLNSPFLL